MCGLETAFLVAVLGATCAGWRGQLAASVDPFVDNRLTAVDNPRGTGCGAVTGVTKCVTKSVTRDEIVTVTSSPSPSPRPAPAARAARVDRPPAMTGAERMRRCRARKRAALAAAAAPVPVSDDSVTGDEIAPSPSLPRAREEEESFVLFSSGNAPARDDRHIRRERLLHLALPVAKRDLKSRHYERLIEQINAKGRYERFLARGTGAFPAEVRDYLEHLFKQVQSRPPAETEPIGRPLQGEMLLPIGGGRPRPPPSPEIQDAARRLAFANVKREAG